MRNTLTLHPRLSTAALAMALLAPIASQAEAQRSSSTSAPSPAQRPAPVRPAEPDGCSTAPMKCKALRSNAVRGQLSVEAALAELLRGTGASYSLQGSSVTISAQRSADYRRQPSLQGSRGFSPAPMSRPARALRRRQYRRRLQIDPYTLERIEVLKGPASVLYGQNEPGGIVNMVSKRPTATRSAKWCSAAAARTAATAPSTSAARSMNRAPTCTG